MKKKRNVKIWNGKGKPHNYSVNKKQLKTSLGIALILMIVLVTTHLIPSLYIGLAPGEYEYLGPDEWIAAGEDPIDGRFFKIDRTSHLSGLSCSHFEVFASGFPVSCCFVEDIWSGEFGIYVFNPLMALLDFIILTIIVLLVIVVFRLYESKKLKGTNR